VKVVIATNVFISSLLTPKGNPRRIIDLWRFEKITLCISKDILAEYFAVLFRLSMSEEPETVELLQLFEKRYNQVFTAAVPVISAIEEDPADNKFIECAVAAGAEYIVSGDRHLLKRSNIGGIRILTPAEFLKVVPV